MDVRELSGRQREIVEASIRIISKGGIQDLTIKNLAAGLDLSEPALYRHFENKQDILLGLLEFFKGRQLEMYARIRKEEPSPRKAIESMITRVFGNFSSNPAMITVIFAEGMFQNDDRLSAMVYSIMEDRRRQFRSLIGEGQRKGEIRRDVDKDQLALIVMGSMRLMVTRWRLSGFGFNLVAEGRKFLGTLRKLLE